MSQRIPDDKHRDTPRTDAVVDAEIVRNFIPQALIDIARQLERELAEAARWKDMYWDRARAEREAAQSSTAAINPAAFDLPELDGPTPCTDQLIGEKLGRLTRLSPDFEYAQEIIKHAKALERLFWRERKSSHGLMGLLHKARGDAEVWLTAHDQQVGRADKAEAALAQSATAFAWIPVSERLPNRGDTVLLRHTGGEFAIADIADLNNDERGFFVRGSFFEWTAASHWMPIPSLSPSDIHREGKP